MLLDMGDEPSRADNTFHVVMSYNPKVRGCLQESGPLGDLSGFTITAGHASASNDTTTPGGGGQTIQVEESISSIPVTGRSIRQPVFGTVSSLPTTRGQAVAERIAMAANVCGL